MLDHETRLWLSIGYSGGLPPPLHLYARSLSSLLKAFL